MKQFLKVLLIGVSWIWWHAPAQVKWFFGSILAFLWFDVFRIRRYTLLRGISIAFPELGKPERYKIARQSLRHMCFNFFEILSVPQLNADRVRERVVFHGMENYEAAHHQGKGILVLACHVGNGDFAASATALMGIKIDIISKRFSNKVFDDLWFGIRKSHGVGFIEAHGLKSAQDIIAACKRNEMVVFVTDQYIAAPYGIENKFFGRKTGTPTGLARFALKLKAPVLPIYYYHDENMKTHVVFDPIIDVPADVNAKDEGAVAALTDRFNHHVEGIIRKHPAQWMWLHRRWKKFR